MLTIWTGAMYFVQRATWQATAWQRQINGRKAEPQPTRRPFWHGFFKAGDKLTQAVQ
jgi:hypothetical protein